MDKTKKESRRKEDRENLDRWLVSYADFITLLFAFFVMLYAVTSMNNGKFRVLSSALEETLNHQKPSTAPAFDVPEDMTMPGRASPPARSALFHTLDTLVERSAFRGEMKVLPTPQGTILRIQSRFLFRSGHASLRRRAVGVLKKIGRVLSGRGRRIHVRGYTDNLPIRTDRYPNNWALSGMRAVNVLVALVRMGGIRPDQGEAVGFGKNRPIASNLTPEGREANRRVDIFVVRNSPQPSKPQMLDENPQSGSEGVRPFLKKAPGDL